MLQRVGADHWSLWLSASWWNVWNAKPAEVEALFHRLEGDPTETLYHMVAKAFGLKANADPFGMLAHALPLGCSRSTAMMRCGSKRCSLVKQGCCKRIL